MSELGISILTGLSIGFLGSFHCIGMCGPIALALPVHAMNGVRKYISIALYNLGRAMTYGILGLIFGWVGSQFRLWGLQQFLSMGAGLLILLFLLTRYSVISRIVGMNRITMKVQSALGRILQSPKKATTFFSIGLLNGLLPCGLVYVAVAAALATTHIISGSVLMVAFGLGTIPVMAGLMTFGHLISVPVRQKINRAVPYFVGVMALMLILRGMNLGIPYLSPKMDPSTAGVECCHRKD